MAKYRYRQLAVGSKSLEPKDVDSECVASLSYDPEREQMTVEFQERGSYVYFDVDPWVFSEFNNAGSRGVYFNTYIRDRFEYERIA